MAGAMAGTAILHSKPTDTLHTVTLTINNKCNLSCPHCYLQYNGEESEIGEEILSLVYESKFSHLAIVGKEPLLNTSSIKLCEQIAKTAFNKSKSVSLITNGLNLSQVTPDLLKCLAYIDLSLDGGPATYEQYRKGSFAKVIAGVAHVGRSGFSNVNALHVLNNRTIHNIDDMMRVSEFFDFKHIMFSPYVDTSNYGANSVNVLPVDTIFHALSNSELFMMEQRASLLIGANDLSSPDNKNCSVEELAAAYGIANKIRYIKEDPLLYGIIRVTYDGYVLTPYQSLHTIDYHREGFDLSKVNPSNIFLEDVYQNIRMDHAYTSF